MLGQEGVMRGGEVGNKVGRGWRQDHRGVVGWRPNEVDQRP